jgi:hypothetical protein
MTGQEAPGQAARNLGRAAMALHSGQVAGAAAAGVVLACAVIAIWNATARADVSCSAAGEMCFDGLFGVAAVAVAGESLAAFTVLRITPLAVGVPAAGVATILMVNGMRMTAAGGAPPSAWAAALLMAAGFAVVAAALVAERRARIAALSLLAAFVLAWVLAPGPIGSRALADRERVGLAALPFRLELPVVAGYKIADAYPDAGSLDVALAPASARRDREGIYEDTAIMVTIRRASSTDEAPASCAPGPGAASSPAAPGKTVPPVPPLPPGQDCLILGSGMWSTDLGAGLLTVSARHGDVIVIASTVEGPLRVPSWAAAQAAASLRPATVAQVQAVEAG